MYTLDLSPYNLIIIASVFIGLIFGLLLIFAKRINQKANRYLGLLALVIVLWNVWVLSLDLDVFRYMPRFYLMPLNFSLAVGPLLYLYIKKMTNPSWSFTKKTWVHFLPLVLELGVHGLMCKEALSKQIIAANTDAFMTFVPLVQLLAIISILSYSYAGLSLIRKYHVWLKSNYSNDDKYNLRWLYRLTIVFAVLWFMLVPYTLVDYFFYGFGLGIRDYYPMYILLSVITIWISAEAFLKPEMVFVEKRNEVEDDVKNIELKVDPAIKEQASWLKNEMKHHQYYLDSEISLKSLATELNMHPNSLSKLINDGLDQNFSDFINEYRVSAVIDRLKDPKYDHISLLGISFECGFNSKSTFNRVFKNVTGKTPLQYKKT